MEIKLEGLLEQDGHSVNRLGGGYCWEWPLSSSRLEMAQNNEDDELHMKITHTDSQTSS